MASELADGLEALQREWRERAVTKNNGKDMASAASRNRLLECSDALAPHIAAAKAREELLAKLVEFLRSASTTESCHADTMDREAQEAESDDEAEHPLKYAAVELLARTRKGR
jgi:hypothetical protein